MSRDVLLAHSGELAARVAEREAVIAELPKRSGVLEQRLAGRAGPGMPDHKPPPTTAKPPPKERKKRGQGFGRPRRWR